VNADRTKPDSKAVRSPIPDRLAPTLAFDGPVAQVHAVSSGRAAALAKMKVRTVRDLITHFPRRYIDMSHVETVLSASIGETCTIVGEVLEIELKRPRPRLSLTEITLHDGTCTLMVTCFRQDWLKDRLHQGDRIAVSGKLEFNYGFKRMTNPFIEPMEQSDGTAGGLIVAVHPASEKISTAWMRRLVGNALDLCCGIDDPLPLGLRTRYRLQSRQTALRCIHFPSTMDEAAAARRRLTYEEVLLLELHLMRRHAAPGATRHGRVHEVDGPRLHALMEALPFRLTDEQEAARRDLLGVLASDKPGNHMLLGDVGTGKTVIAAFGLAVAADSGTQALMMAPTEVLALQYAQSIGPLLDRAGVPWGLLTGSTSDADRRELLGNLASGSVSALFGTHALLEDDVRPRDCTLVVIDEQQRFGVDQRAALVAKGHDADIFSMTATPIPRSLALALYGDMTLSYLKARPLNRAGIETRVFARTQKGAAYEMARDELDAGHQVYVVCPLVGQAPAGGSEDASAKGSGASSPDDAYAYSSIAIEGEADMQDDDARAAVQQARFLQEKIFCGYRVGVLHGRMGSADKQGAMDAFRSGETQVLVATTVIEVGVDVPNATVMIIEDADRFGLAQLHQLRGRVGRGDCPGLVCLISGSKAPVALERLSAMESIDSGFRLAEYDLSLRREGDILGNRQHGASVLKLVNVVRDADIIEAAHDDARAIVDSDPDLNLPEHQALRHEVSRMFPRKRKEG
jgi:ATP-dependent DNA helicase RecG